MHMSVTEPKSKLTDLIRRAAAGDKVILARHGHPAVRLVPVEAVQSKVDRRAILEKLMREATPTPGPCAARSADFLFDEDGLPA